ncbi:MAG: DegV family protein [Peptococcaceae bacterium]|jgi:DegV family protein with EDD domain|nr:DegV family protein [Peptococcaceae bacterium]
MGVQILTDSTSYLGEKIRQEFNIRRVALSVTFGDHSIKEIEIDNSEFYKMMEERDIPTSSQPPLGELFDQMAEVAEKGDSLCGIFMSSELSGTMSATQMAKEIILNKYHDAKIELIDSRSTCMQLGFAVIQAAKAAKAGKTLEQVKECVLHNIKRSRFLFIPASLEYLKKGGRIGGAAALIGSLFKITPILTVENGKTTVYKKVRTKKNAVVAMINKMMQDFKNCGFGEIVVHHINCLDEAKELAELIRQKLGTPMEMDIVTIGPVVGMHVGPGAIGVTYYTENELV